MNIISQVDLRLTAEGVVIPANTRLTFTNGELVLTPILSLKEVKLEEQEVKQEVNEEIKQEEEKEVKNDQDTKIQKWIELYETPFEKCEDLKFFSCYHNEDPIMERYAKGIHDSLQKRDTSMFRKINASNNIRLREKIPDSQKEEEEKQQLYESKEKEPSLQAVFF